MCNTKIDKIVKSLVAPSQTNVGWLDLNDNALKFFVNGQWVETKDEKGVQPDWNQADNTKLDYIKNKPTIPDESPFEAGTGLNSAVLKNSSCAANGEKSVAEGFNNTIWGAGSHIEGYNNSCHSVGYQLKTGVHIEGAENYFGDNSAAGSDGVHIEGKSNACDKLAFGSHVEGYQHGINPIGSTGYGIHVEGKFSKFEQDRQHIVGIGTSTSNRKNAHEISTDGKHYIYGIGGYDGTNSTASGIKDLATLLSDIANILTFDASSVDPSDINSSSTGPGLFGNDGWAELATGKYRYIKVNGDNIRPILMQDPATDPENYVIQFEVSMKTRVEIYSDGAAVFNL